MVAILPSNLVPAGTPVLWKSIKQVPIALAHRAILVFSHVGS
jgi:hypothetical protein